MFSFDSKIRFSETDKNQKLKLSGIINYFQDCSTFQSESLGLGIDDLKEYGKSWVLSSWQIIVNRYPVLGENIKVETWPTGFEGPYGTRNFRLRTVEGEVLAYANSIWVFMDIKRGRPCRPTEADVKDYPIEPAMEMDYVSRKVILPQAAEEKGQFQVCSFQLDANNHMNNSQYVALAQEILPEGYEFNEIHVEYKKSAMYGDMIHAKLAVEENRNVVVLADENEKVYAAIEFK